MTCKQTMKMIDSYGVVVCTVTVETVSRPIHDRVVKEIWERGFRDWHGDGWKTRKGRVV